METPEIHSKLGFSLSLLLTALALGIAICFAYLIQPTFIRSTNNRTTDILMLLAPKKEPSGAVVIVDIDEASLARYGQWPWPRYRIAQLLRTINASGAACIGLDLILAESDRCSQEYNQNSNQAGAASPADGDRDLAETLANGPYVLGYEFLFGDRPKPQQSCPLHPPGIVWIGRDGKSPELWRFFEANGVVCNRRQFGDAVKRSGFLNAIQDADGLLRRVPLVIRFDEYLYPSLDLAMLMRYLHSSQIEILNGENGALGLRVAGRSIWVDSGGNMVVQFAPRVEPAARVSAGDLLDGKISQGRLKGKLVLIGASAAGLEPVYRTPSKAIRGHADVHAQVLDNMLTGENVIRTRRFLIWEALIAMIAALGSCLAIARLNIASSAAVCAALLAVCWIGMRVLFEAGGYLLSPLLPTVVVAVDYAVLTILKSWKNQHVAKQRAETALELLKKSERLLVEKHDQLEEINLNLEKRISEAVNDLRKKDQIMIQQGRQAAMGEMIGNIAHQWRQPLNTLGLIVQELKMTYGQEGFSKETLDANVQKAMKLIAHMSKTIEGFSNYFRPDREMRRFSVNQSVVKTLSLIEPSLKSLNIEVEVATRGEIEIEGYENGYSQVLLNILLNCRDAFEEGAREKRQIIAIAVFRENGRSVVTVADNAGGIPEEILDKIFDPYFTTKEPDKGTGIGLYMAKAIIERNMGGKLSARNVTGGAEFRIEV